MLVPSVSTPAVVVSRAMPQVLLQDGANRPVVNITSIGPGFESSMAVNPIDPSNIVVTGGASGSSGTLGLVRVSHDGGKTWSITNTSFTYVDSVVNGLWEFFDPVGTFDANGYAYVGTVGNGTMDWLFKSTDGGRSFTLTSPFLKMNDSLLYYQHGTYVHPCNDRNAPHADYPAVIANSYPSSPYRNNVYVLVRAGAQLTPTVCEYGAAFERSTDGGKTWGNGTWFAGADTFVSDNRGMAVAPDGTVFLAGVGGSCLFDTSCFSSDCPVTENPVGMVFKSTDGGTTFQAICAVDDPHFGPDEVEVAATSASTIYVVFLGRNETAAPNHLHLYSLGSHDGGSTWSPMTRVDNVTSPDFGHIVSAGGPFMWDFSLSQRTGRLDVAWLDDRNNGGNYTLADMYYSYSFGGMSWATNIRATPNGPYYICTARVTITCRGTGNDFMWVASPYPSSDKAYIVASLGSASCGSLCSALLTRLVTVTFPSPSIGVSLFFTSPSLNPLPLDNSGNSLVDVLFARGTVQTTHPIRVLAWLNVTNTGSIPLQSLRLDETLPVDWRVTPAWMPARAAVQVYYANATSLSANPVITPSNITVATGDPETVSLNMSDLTATAIGHALMPGQSLLVSVRLSYALTKTNQSLSSYPRNYTDTVEAMAWTDASYTGAESLATVSDFFTAYARALGQMDQNGV